MGEQLALRDALRDLTIDLEASEELERRIERRRRRGRARPLWMATAAAAVVFLIFLLIAKVSDGGRTIRTNPADPGQVDPTTSTTVVTAPSGWDCTSIKVGDAVPVDFSSRPCDPTPRVFRYDTECLDGTKFMFLSFPDSSTSLGGFDGGTWFDTDGPPADCRTPDHPH